MRFTWLILAISLFQIILFNCHFAIAIQFFPAHSGVTFGSRSREPKYKIEFHPEDSSFYPGEDQESVVMPDKDGQKYLCYLPKVEKPKSGKPVTQQNTSSVIVDSEDRFQLKTPDELLEVLQDKCFIMQESWWSYNFCYQKELRQIHVEDNKIAQEYVLGVFDAKAKINFNQNLSDVSKMKDPHSKDKSQRYHAHQYTNGTTCDLTNKPRETEVRFVCSESSSMISSFTELSTCKFFQEERPVWHTINCNVLSTNRKETKVEGKKYKDQQITMVEGMKYPTRYESE